ncbi:sialate O-acetylesterase, partial [Litorivicinus sp.]|nr:sialate O-acetylesterase [Litorivicinus sp.]
SKVAKNLVDNGLYEQVVLVSTGVGGSHIARWADDNDLNRLLKGVLANLLVQYDITEMIWHQGEADREYTFSATYRNMFLSMLTGIREAGVSAPIFVSIASICGNSWQYPNRITNAQKDLALITGIEAGVNTDELVPITMRYDNCHFGKIGQELIAEHLSQLILSHRKEG